MQKLLALFLALCAGCAAQMKSTVTETSVVAGKPVTTTVTSNTDCRGLGCTAHEIANLEINRMRATDQGDIGKAAIAKGMPTQLGPDGVQAGYTYGYGTYGMYGANMYGSPAIAATEAASMGHAPGLPPLRQGQYYQTSQPQGGASGGGAIEQRLDRIERDQAVMVRNELKKK